MVLGFGPAKGASPAKTRPDDVAALIAKKDYARAIAVIRKKLETQKHDSRLRLQLGDLLFLAGKQKEAVAILTPLADEFAREGFAAKAVAVLKKIQKIDPLQKSVDAKLASLIQEKQKQATVAAPAAAALPEFGMEEIGFEPPPGGDGGGRGFVPQFEAGPEAELPIAAEPAPARVAFEPEPEPEPVAAAPPPPPAPAPAPPPAPVPPAPAPVQARAPMPAPVEDYDLIDETAEDALPIEGDAGIGGDLTLEPPAAAEPELSLEPPPAAEPELTLEPEAVPSATALELEAMPEAEPEPAIELEPEPEAPVEPMTESDFADELMDLVEGAFSESPAASAAAPAPAAGGNQIVVSPLFKDFSVDEMVAVIQGLNLITFEAGDIILTEGDPGDSLYMLTSGTVKAVKRNAAGKQVAVSEMTEGAFFGEISILTGQPRTATVVATSHCELLELDRKTLDSIVATHPHVRQVLEQFSKERLARLPKR